MARCGEHIRPANEKACEQADYTAATAEAAVKAGRSAGGVDYSAGFGERPIAFGPDAERPTIRMLNDASDTIAPQMVAGLLQKAAMTSMPDVMAEQGSRYFDQYVGRADPEQQKTRSSQLAALRTQDGGAKPEPEFGRNRRRSGGIVR